MPGLARLGQPLSPWLDTPRALEHPPLKGDVEVDVAVLGGGIAGVTAAHALKLSGRTVALVEADRVASGVTGSTTAKVTSAHGVLYGDLTKSFGRAAAGTYAAANQAAIEHIAALVERHSIVCGFRRRAAYTYTESAENVDALRREAMASVAAGLPARFVHDVPLPFPVAGAVMIRDQAEFDPVAYLRELAGFLPGGGSHVFERTWATDVHDGSPCVVETDRGELRATDVVIATHYPFLDRALLFARLAQMRSYALGVRIEGHPPDGMFLSVDEPTRSLRGVPLADGSELLIVGGEGHKVGQDDETADRYRALAHWAEDRFGVLRFDYRWASQDAASPDRLPFVGRLTAGSERLWVATGFNKWGMTNGTAAGLLLADRIEGVANPAADLLDPNRLNLRVSAKRLVTENLDVARRFFGDRLARPTVTDAEDLERGEGGIARVGGRRVGAYRDEGGRLHAVVPICTHLGCQVAWNEAERSWDCPCHGSRFAPDGQVLEGPAVEPLPAWPIPEPATARPR